MQFGSGYAGLVFTNEGSQTMIASLRTPLTALIAVILAAVSGCGGGGGGDSGSTSVAPTATSGTLATDEDTPKQGTLNASYPKNDHLTYRIVKNGNKGTVTITNASTGAFTYTPNPDANGSDTFRFKANDGLMDSKAATVKISINPINDAPIATSVCSTTPQAQTMAGTLNATDLETPALLMYSLNADGSGGIGPITTSKGATVTITNQTTGAFTYQPDTVAGNKRGKDMFDYQVTDQDGGVASATQTIIVDQTIMPLGDSITAGDIAPPDVFSGGYRKPLYDKLLKAGFTFDFVGSQNDGYGFDFNHEGHGGWNARDIAWGRTDATDDDGVYAWLDANPADIVLLHAGSNGLAADTDDVEAILNEIQRWEDSAEGNHVIVVLAKIIDYVPHKPVVDEFNTNLQSMADNRIANGDDIIVVDQWNALNYQDDMSNYVHPNDIGYAKMSNVWFNALTNIVDKCP
jgi:hypothetical protein